MIFNPARKYFNKIQQEEGRIGAIVESLKTERNILNNDNITLEIEIKRLNNIIEKLNKEYQSGILLKDEVNSIIEKAHKATRNFYILNIIEPLEKKLYDIKQMVVIKEQSILAIEMVRRNNKEIIRNIDRIKNVTLQALNTAVMVAKSLYKQKIVLNKINELEKDTNNFIINTADRLSIQEENVYNKASNNTIESLQDAFKNIINTINDVNIQNKKSFPENEIKIIELKKGEGYHEEL